MAGVVASQSSGRTDRRLTVHLLLGVLGRLSAEVQRQSFAEIRVDGEEELLSFALNPDLYDPELADDMLAQGIRVGGQVAYRSNRAVTSPSAAREGVVDGSVAGGVTPDSGKTSRRSRLSRVSKKFRRSSNKAGGSSGSSNSSSSSSSSSSRNRRGVTSEPSFPPPTPTSPLSVDDDAIGSRRRLMELATVPPPALPVECWTEPDLGSLVVRGPNCKGGGEWRGGGVHFLFFSFFLLIHYFIELSLNPFLFSFAFDRPTTSRRRGSREDSGEQRAALRVGGGGLVAGGGAHAEHRIDAVQPSAASPEARRQHVGVRDPDHGAGPAALRLRCVLRAAAEQGRHGDAARPEHALRKAGAALFLRRRRRLPRRPLQAYSEGRRGKLHRAQRRRNEANDLGEEA